MIQETAKAVKSNPGGRLLDIGDGVAHLEFLSRNGAIGYDFIDMIEYSVERVKNDFTGLVISNPGRNFSVGANLMLVFFMAQGRNWSGLDLLVRRFQNATRCIRYSERPVVVCPAGMTLGGGCEICLPACRIIAEKDVHMGLVEVGVGVIPAGGGCVEMLLRSMPADSGVRSTSAFEIIAQTKVSAHADDAKQQGFLREADGCIESRDNLVNEAKNAVLSMAGNGYQPPPPAGDLMVTGSSYRATIRNMVTGLSEGEGATECDRHMLKTLAHVLTGGDAAENAAVDEDQLLKLEREAFVSLCQEKKTQERMLHMLKTGKKLKN